MATRESNLFSVHIAKSVAVTTLRLRSAAGGDAVPFAVGHAFREGDVPSGSRVSATGPEAGALQMSVKNVWPDGSVKFAILAGRCAMTANAETTLSLFRAPPEAPRAPLTTAHLVATGASATIAFGSAGSASIAGAEWHTPFLSWISGAEMSSWLYRKPIGSDPHLVAWFEVRLFAGGALEVVPWVENGYLKVPGPGARAGTASFTLGGLERFSQPLNLLNHQRAYLGSGTTFSHWLGADPGLSWRHDTAYLQSTTLTPSYRAVTSASSPLWSRQPSGYQPLAQAGFPTNMPGAGYNELIGPLPEWDVAYLTSDGDVRAWRSVQINALCGGRYGIHFRDELTNRPIRFSARPNLAVNDASPGLFAVGGGSSTNDLTTPATGAVPPTYDNAHHGVWGYFAYLITGRFYFLEELQFIATVNYLKNADNQRGFGEGWFEPHLISANQHRGAWWSVRTLAFAASATPDDDALKGDFVASCNSNVAFVNGRFNQSYNALGVAWGGSASQFDYLGNGGADVRFGYAPWQDNWCTFAFALMKDLKVCTGNAAQALDTFLQWKFKSIVGLLGGDSTSAHYWPFAGRYDCPIAPNDQAPLTAATSWYQSWGEAYTAGGGGAYHGNAMQGTSASAPGEMPTGYWGNLQPALAYAVDQGAPGAAEAYARLVGADNWAASAAGFNDAPIWSVKPRSR